MDDNHDEAQDYVPDGASKSRRISPSPAGLRQRLPSKNVPGAETRFNRRSSSFMSDTLTDSRASLKASTDDLFLPRVRHDQVEALESSNWHSLPLGLALLPAVGGLFFKNGSAFVTDVTLLALAALFLNWAVRLPWDWYLSAQAVAIAAESPDVDHAPEQNGDETAIGDDASKSSQDRHSNPARAAEAELRLHEVSALVACFLFPALGAWLLHAIRSQLSRPSEGLVSDYNLTIFLLASEVRPLSHAIKLVQRRTLFLQRTISASEKQGTDFRQDNKIEEMARRLEELEVHMVEAASSNIPPSEVAQPQEMIAKTSLLVSEDMRKSIQPEVDALSRAMRRYEKKITVSAIQTEARLQDIEAKMQDIVVLAAAAQRNADKSYAKYTTVLTGWISACVVIPIRYTVYFLTLPQRVLARCVHFVGVRLGFIKSRMGRGDIKNGARPAMPSQRIKEKRLKSVT